jgi:uncharacterized protein YdeI (YjbR/CyaY-like superfamily)
MKTKILGRKAPVQAPVLVFRLRNAWERWLAKHYASSNGVWLKFYRKDSGKPSITHVEALHGALCYGWVDGQKKLTDDVSWLQHFKPRPPRSRWSRLHTENAERLIKAGRMTPAGLKQVKAAKRDGRWRWAYDPPGSAKIPVDLLQQLAKAPASRAFFESLGKADSYAIAYRLQSARDPQIRARRLRAILSMLARSRRPSW